MNSRAGILFIVLVLFSCIAVSLGESIVGEDLSSRRRTSNEDVAAYWTEERLRSAIPADFLYTDDVPEQSPEDSANMRPSTVEEPVFGEGRDSILFPSEVNEQFEDVNGTERAKRAYPYPYSAAFTSSGDYYNYPWRTVGKVFYTSGGQNWVCSGSVLRQNLVATAGHCVYDLANGWVSNWIFVPGYNNGLAPHGIWYYYQLWAAGNWIGSGNVCRDYGFAVIWRNNGVSIGDAIGYLGYVYNAAYGLSWRALGYPQAAPFNGQEMYYSDAALGNTVSNNGCSPVHMGIGSAATGGVSGGPWIYQFGSNNYLNSVHSWKYFAEPDAVYGPYFDTLWFNDMSTAAAVNPI